MGEGWTKNGGGGGLVAMVWVTCKSVKLPLILKGIHTEFGAIYADIEAMSFSGMPCLFQHMFQQRGFVINECGC